MTDPNMLTALAVARGLGSAPRLPTSIGDVRRRAELIDAIDRCFAGETFDGTDVAVLLWNVGSGIGESVAAFARISEKYLPTVPDPLDRVNVACRLWAGCLSAAKVIAAETLSGPNTAETRTRAWIDLSVAKDDAIFAAGVEAAPWFKRLRDQDYAFDGRRRTQWSEAQIPGPESSRSRVS